MIVKCKFCGADIDLPNFIHYPCYVGSYTCGKCTSYCFKQCPIGKSGETQGWHYEPCLSCDNNPYKIYKSAETV